MTLLQIGKADESSIEVWFEKNATHFQHLQGQDEKVKGFVDHAASIGFVIAFLNAVVLVDRYAGGLNGLFEKATSLLVWLGTRNKADLTLRERVLAVVFQMGTGKAKGVSKDVIYQVVGGTKQDVDKVISELCSARVIVENKPYYFTLLVN